MTGQDAADPSGSSSELGRQPRATGRLIKRHSDRVLFGTDVFPIHEAGYRVYFRLLETEDEQFPYSAHAPPPNGRWAISGLGLPDNMLKAVYLTNARRLLAASPASGRL